VGGRGLLSQVVILGKYSDSCCGCWVVAVGGGRWLLGGGRWVVGGGWWVVGGGWVGWWAVGDGVVGGGRWVVGLFPGG